MAGGGAMNLTEKMRSVKSDRALDSVFASAPSNSFLGPGAMVSFGGVGGVNGSRNSIYHPFYLQENGDECSDDYFNLPEKKRRLSVDQVRFLERSFEVENKLEPDRKLKLANELSLQPRQIAVWFQNRRARCKTKNLESEYETLHSSYKSLRTDYDSLLEENEKLKAEVLHLKHEEEPSEAMLKEDGAAGTVDEHAASFSTPKNEEQNEPRLESGPVQSALWMQGEEDWLNEESLQRTYVFPKIEDAHCHPHATYRGYGFGVDQDHASTNFWSY